ncbi:MAG TPA: cupredoxin domain-containing protein [Actinomycetota bacterium]|nr:cupredoxin domain-containing protein [Actinomycetota bacterium]
MRRLTGSLLGSVLLLALGACSSGGGGGGDAQATCKPAGSSLTEEAKAFKFVQQCLAAPADTKFTIAFHNADSGVRHNITILDAKSNKVFAGTLITGDKNTTYNVDALPAGTYSFRCDVHPPEMTGVFVIQ